MSIREGMIRAKLDKERHLEFNQALSMGATQENLEATMRQIRNQASLRSNKRIFLQSSAENDVNDEYFMDEFDDA